MNNLIKQIVEKFNFNIDIEDNEMQSSLSKSKYNSISQKQLYIEYTYVDLGLPSGTLWAKCNIGAESPEEFGDYYAWGEIKQKQEYRQDNYKFGYPPTKYNKKDNLKQLQLEDDAAYQFDHRMKMPTIEQFKELIDNTEYKWIKNYNGVKGGLFVGKNGNKMFIPASGYYNDGFDIWVQNDVYLWSSNIGSNYPDYVSCMYFGLDNVRCGSYWRYRGRCIRPVCKKEI